MRKSPEGDLRETLSIDLTERRFRGEPLAGELSRAFLGGHGMAVKLAYDNIPTGSDPLSSANALVFSAGPLVGTMAPTAARATLAAKSPLSGFIGYSNAGHFGAMLRFAGYDNLVISGQSDYPIYVVIDNDGVRFCDASHLWGKDIYEATDVIWEELGDDYWVACIGPAGENLVKYACVVNNKHSAFGRTGLGAVMGSKNLKAVAIKGHGSVNVAQPGRFLHLVDEVLRRINSLPKVIDEQRKLGTQVNGLVGPQFKMVALPHGETEVTDVDKYLSSFRVSNIACSACPVGCKAWMEHTDGVSLGASCTFGTVTGPYGFGLATPTYRETALIAQLGQRLGFDSMNAAYMVGLAIELYQAGIITEVDTGGLQLRWGDSQVVIKLLHQIAERNGLGDILAESVKVACSRIGKAAEDYGIHIKGLVMAPEMFPDMRSVVSFEQLGCMVNPRGWHIDGYRGRTLFYQVERAPQKIREYGPQMGIPGNVVDRILSWPGYDIPLFTKYAEDYNTLLNDLGVCDRGYICRAYDVDILADLYVAATGLDAKTTDLLLAAERAVNVAKAFNVREGATRADDQLPARLTREPLSTRSGIRPPASAEQYNQFLDRYYEAHGWDPKTGIPIEEKLQSLDLYDVARDLTACRSAVEAP